MTELRSSEMAELISDQEGEHEKMSPTGVAEDFSPESSVRETTGRLSRQISPETSRQGSLVRGRLSKQLPP